MKHYYRRFKIENKNFLLFNIKEFVRRMTESIGLKDIEDLEDLEDIDTIISLLQKHKIFVKLHNQMCNLVKELLEQYEIDEELVKRFNDINRALFESRHKVKEKKIFFELTKNLLMIKLEEQVMYLDIMTNEIYIDRNATTKIGQIDTTNELRIINNGKTIRIQVKNVLPNEEKQRYKMIEGSLNVWIPK